MATANAISKTSARCGQPKWATLINDVLVYSPQRLVRVEVLKAQGGIANNQVLVRDHNSPNDFVLQDDEEIDLANGNVFYSIASCESKAGGKCSAPPKLAFIVDDRAEITTKAEQTGKTLRDLFNLEPDVRLLRDFESPNDDAIDAADVVLFSDGPVFVTRSNNLVIIVNGRRRKVEKTVFTFDEIVNLAFDDPPQGPFICFTITYRGGDCSKPEGTLLEGESITIVNGMIFNVTATDKS